MKVSNKLKVVMGVAICSLVLVGCGDGAKKASAKQDSNIQLTNQEFPITEEKVTFTMMGPNVGLAEWKDMPFFKDYAEKTNIDFDFITPPLLDFPTKLNLALASGDLPDVIFGAGENTFPSSMEMDYGKQGAFVPLEGLIDDNMPNLKALMDENPDIKRAITTPEGHIYSLPTVSTASTAIWPRGPMWYRGDWLEAVGQKELPKTTDEFYDLMVKFRDEDPNKTGKDDTIPLTDVKMESIRPWLMGAFGMRSFGLEVVDGKVQYTPITENYKEYVTFMNKMYSEKLLDQEVFGQSQEQTKAKGQNNQIGLFSDWFSYFTTGQTEEEALNNPMFQPLTSDISKEAVVPKGPGILRTTLTITKNAASPEAILRWADYFYSEEGSFYLNFGPEGEFWEFTENDKGEKVRVFTDKVDKTNIEESRGKVTPAYGTPVPRLDQDWPTDMIVREDANKEPDTRFNDFITTETESKIKAYGQSPMPQLYLTNDETDQVKDMATELRTYTEQMEAKFITGVEPLSNWDKYVKTVESMGVEKYIDVYQEAVDRYYSN